MERWGPEQKSSSFHQISKIFQIARLHNVVARLGPGSKINLTGGGGGGWFEKNNWNKISVGELHFHRRY